MQFDTGTYRYTGAGSGRRKPSPEQTPHLSLPDDELNDLAHLAQAVPVDHRAAYLEAVAAALGEHATLGPGIVHRTAVALRRRFVVAPPLRPHIAGYTSKYR